MGKARWRRCASFAPPEPGGYSREVASGAKTDRPQLRRLLAQIGRGDVVTVTRLDRLARSTRDTPQPGDDDITIVTSASRGILRFEASCAGRGHAAQFSLDHH